MSNETMPPDIIKELVKGFQYQADVQIPGPNGESYVFTIGVLWDDEERALQREIGLRINPNDFVARQLESRYETVVRSCIAIAVKDRKDEPWQVIILGDEEETRYRRQELRKILDKLPKTIEHLYDKYTELVARRNEEFQKAVDDIKKSSRTPSTLENLDIEETTSDSPSDSPSGEDGGA